MTFGLHAMGGRGKPLISAGGKMTLQFLNLKQKSWTITPLLDVVNILQRIKKKSTLEMANRWPIHCLFRSSSWACSWDGGCNFQALGHPWWILTPSFWTSYLSLSVIYEASNWNSSLLSLVLEHIWFMEMNVVTL